MAEEEQLNGMPQSMDTDDWAGTESDNEHDVDVDTTWTGPKSAGRSQSGIPENSIGQTDLFSSRANSMAPHEGTSYIAFNSRGRPFKRVKVDGGSMALPRRITAELDSEDEMIMRLKESGYSDQQVVSELRRQGRTSYDRKTINSRSVRIKRAIAARQDELLEDGLTDWHEGEDEALLEAHALAVAHVNQEIEKLREKRFVLAARFLQRLRPNVRYSGKACQKRYIALVNGEATIPPELDDDPAKRAEEKAARALAKLARKQATEKAIADERERGKLAEEEARLKAEERRRDWAEKGALAAEAKAAKRRSKVDLAEKRRLEQDAKARSAAVSAAEKKGRVRAREEALAKTEIEKEAALEFKREAAAKGRAEKKAKKELTARAITTQPKQLWKTSSGREDASTSTSIPSTVPSDGTSGQFSAAPMSSPVSPNSVQALQQSSAQTTPSRTRSAGLASTEGDSRVLATPTPPKRAASATLTGGQPKRQRAAIATPLAAAVQLLKDVPTEANTATPNSIERRQTAARGLAARPAANRPEPPTPLAAATRNASPATAWWAQQHANAVATNGFRESAIRSTLVERGGTPRTAGAVPDGVDLATDG